jgi:ABC-type multidrug transport system ATPase subunit
VRCERLAYRHPAGFQLGPIDLDGPDDRPWLVMGRSGSGKTTLLRLLAGWLRPTSGRVDRSPGAAYLPQLPERVMAGRNLAEDLCGQIRPPREARARLREALGAAGLRGIPLSRRSRDLSLGERRRAALALLLLSRRNDWALDEPDAGLDASGREGLVDLLGSRSAGGGRRLWVATFRFELYGRLAPWGVVLEAGRVAATGSLGELVSGPRARTALGLDARPAHVLREAVRGRKPGETGGGCLGEMQALLEDRAGLR